MKTRPYGFNEAQSKDRESWRISTRHVEMAVSMSNNSSPGPDGIPYAAWRHAGRTAILILHAAAEQMQAPDFRNTRLPTGFNDSYLCCLPKKPSGTDQVAGDYFLPSATRPLSLVNTDNRLIASALRIAIEPAVEKVISNMQRGFLRGRKMLTNVLDIDFESMKVSLNNPKGAIILFDFEAAFPSISQSFLLDMLQRVGLPEEVLQVVRALYWQCRCVVKMGGSTFPGFNMSSGVRQGCPLSPLLFVLTVDILLRTLAHNTPLDATIRAFADDVGMVLPSVTRHFSRVIQVYADFARFSGLRLNLHKTVVIPLWQDSLDVARTLLSQHSPEALHMDFARQGTYLGFSVGPDRQSGLWKKALDKFQNRVMSWQSAQLSLHQACLSYNTFIVTVLSYLWQLSSPPQDVRALESLALRKLAPGPGNWILPSDLWLLRTGWGYSNRFVSPHHKALAASVRVCLTDAIDYKEKSNTLRWLLGATAEITNKVAWRDWYDSSFYVRLNSAYQEVKEMGISPSRVLIALLRKHDKDPKGEGKAYSALESCIYEKILSGEYINKQGPYTPYARARTLLNRWVGQSTDRDATRLIRISKVIGATTQPCVHAAVIRTWRNGWITVRRMRFIDHTRQDKCVFGCSPTAHDSIEHYCHCPTLHKAGERALGHHHLCYNIPKGIHSTLLMNDAKESEHIQFLAVWIYLMYSSFNGATHSAQGKWNEDEVVDFLRQKITLLSGQIRSCKWLHPPSTVLQHPLPPVSLCDVELDC